MTKKELNDNRYLLLELKTNHLLHTGEFGKLYDYKAAQEYKLIFNKLNERVRQESYTFPEVVLIDGKHYNIKVNATQGYSKLQEIDGIIAPHAHVREELATLIDAAILSARQWFDLLPLAYRGAALEKQLVELYEQTRDIPNYVEDFDISYNGKVNKGSIL